MGAQYTLAFGEKTSRLELTADMFNVLNTQNLSGYANNATQSNQIHPGPPERVPLVRRIFRAAFGRADVGAGAYPHYAWQRVGLTSGLPRSRLAGLPGGTAACSSASMPNCCVKS